MPQYPTVRQPDAPIISPMQSLPSTESSDPVVANQVQCVDLSLLFTLFVNQLSEVIAQTGGRPLADEFAQQLNRYAGQHGWSVLTGLTDLAELGHRAPEVDARMLASVFNSYAQYALGLARQILGEQLLKSTLATLLTSLPPKATQLNTHYKIIRPI